MVARRQWRWLSIALALVLLAGACGSDGESSSDGSDGADGAAAPAAEPADGGSSPCIVTGDPATGEAIKVGSIQSKTGPDDFSSAGQGARAFFECVNANGGINGRPIDFIVEDDQWSPEVASQAAAGLVNDQNVVAMVGSSSFVECGVNSPLYVDQNVVAIYGTGVPRECFFSPNISATNAGPRSSSMGIAQYMQSAYDAKSLVCISQNIPNTGEWVCTGLEEWGATAGVEVRTILHDPANPDLISVVQDAVADDPDGVIVMEPAGLAIALLSVAEEQDLGDATRWGGPTSLYLDGFPDTIGEYWWGRFDVQAELTTIDATTPDNQAWLETMATYGQSGDPIDTFSQGGWLSAKIFTDTLLSMDGDITRDNVSTAVRAITGFPSDLNCGDWYFGPGDRHNANHAGRIVTINDAGGYELVKDCHEHADPELADVLALEESEGLGG